MLSLANKLNILKSDSLELERQNNEINYIEAFIRTQAESLKPINFLKAWYNYKKYKKRLQEQRTTITDIQVQLKLDGKPIITSDSGHRNIDIDNTNFEKKNIIDITRKSIVNQVSKKSTSFRSQLINRAAKTGLKEYNPFVNNTYVKSSLVPAAPSKMPSYGGREYANMHSNKEFRIGDHHEKPEDKGALKAKIEKFFQNYERSLEEGKVDSIATEAVKR